MKLTLFTLFAVVLLALCVSGGTSEKCAQMKKCPKNIRHVSGLNAAGGCETFSNHCLMKHAVMCEEKNFLKCYRGQTCDGGEDKVIACTDHGKGQ